MGEAIEPSMKHPGQDESLSDAEREYARNLSHLLGRELALHADRFEGYARDDCGVPPMIVYRTMIHGHKHRCAMLAAHMIANERVDDATADRLAEELADDFLKLLKAQIPNSRGVVDNLDRERGGNA
jgi:hypothetical protein